MNYLKKNPNNSYLEKIFYDFCIEANSLDYRGYPFIHYAIEGDRLDLAQFAYEKGANLTKMYHEKHTMSRAISKGDIEIVSWLLKRGFGINTVDDYLLTPLTWAIYKKKPEIATFLLHSGADPNLMENTYNDGNKYNWHHIAISGERIPLLKSATYSQWDIFNTLIYYNANLKVIDRYGKNLLFYLLPERKKEGNFKLFKEFLEKGMDKNSKAFNGDTILTKALSLCKEEVEGQDNYINYLLDIDADVNIMNDEQVTTLMNSIHCSSDIIERVYNRTETHIDLRDASGKTALIHSIGSKNPNSMKFLLDKGSDVKQKLYYESQPILITSIRNSRRIQNLVDLIKAGADVNEPDAYGYTPLMYSSIKFGADIQEAIVLLENGADINAKTKGIGWTALMSAKYSGKDELAEKMIEMGADVTAKTKGEQEFTAFEIPESYQSELGFI